MQVADDRRIRRTRADPALPLREDDAAFGELVERYKDLVYGMVLRLAPDRSQADDLAQDVFLKIHRGLPYFRGEARLSTWIYRIVHERLRAGASRPRARCRSTAGPIGRRSIRRRRCGVRRPRAARSPRKAIAQLPEHYRFLIAAHYLRGVQYEALAEALDIPLGTVKTHLHRAKRQLREILAK